MATNYYKGNTEYKVHFHHLDDEGNVLGVYETHRPVRANSLESAYKKALAYGVNRMGYCGLDITYPLKNWDIKLYKQGENHA